MIKYILSCDEGHQFESWFKSANAFDVLAKAGHISCAACGSVEVKKALMAPELVTRAVSAKPQHQMVSGPNDDIEKALKDLRRKVEKNADYVGTDFAAEARAIHLGDKPQRAIYGESKPEEAKALIEDGVPISPLPFMPKRKTN